MLTEICGELRNWFTSESNDIHLGTFTINDGRLSEAHACNLKEGQYFRIVGSLFNDGVYKNDKDTQLIDEVFNGAIWAMRIPKELISLSEQIYRYNQTEAAKPSAYTSESFGGYSYSKATDSSGAILTWQSVFAKQLNKWRKIR